MFGNINNCHNVKDFRNLAKKRLPSPIFHYIDGAADDEITYKRNTDAYEQCDLIPNVLSGVDKVDMSTTVMGQKLDMPLYCAPTALQRLFHHEGEIGVAKAAEKFGTMFGISSLGTASIEEISNLVKTPKLFQLYVHKDKGLNKALIEKVGEKYLPLFDIKSREKARTTMLNHLNQDNDDQSFPMKPQRVLSDVRKVMDGNDIVLSDVGAHKMWVAREYNCTEPNTCLISNGFCTMGFALPGSMGAKMVFPERKILSINGDAGFFMNVQDLETAVREKLNVVAVVWLDGEYGLIKWKQQIQFDGDHSNLTFDNPDFGVLAKSLNMWGIQINSADEFLPALKEAFKQKGPAIIGVPVDYSENMRLTKHLGKVSQVL